MSNPSDERYTSEEVQNSKVAINRLNDDILYDIFLLTIMDDSSNPQKTALNLSHVCRRWRRSALEYPILWSILDLGSPPRLLDLFLIRSRNSPLTLCWSWKRTPKGSRRNNDIPIMDLNQILPRLCFLRFHLPLSKFTQIRHILHNPDVPPFQPRHLIIGKSYQRRRLVPSPLTDLIRIDTSRLEVLGLELVELPWLELPPHNSLTSFEFRFPIDPPTVSGLLRFLSSCPLLRQLELSFDHTLVDSQVDLDVVRKQPRTTMPKLEQLILASYDTTSYVYFRELSSRIQCSAALCKFILDYDNRCAPLDGLVQDLMADALDSNDDSMGDISDSDDDSLIADAWDLEEGSTKDTTTRNIFEAIPSGLFSNFSSHRFLHVGVSATSNNSFLFEIVSGFKDTDLVHTSPPLKISGSFPKTDGCSLDYLHTVQDLIHAMPGITYLSLGPSAVIPPWVASIPTLFPCLETLRLILSPSSLILRRLPEGLKLRRLVLTNHHVAFIDVIFNLVMRTEAQVLELSNVIFHRKDQHETLKKALKERNVALKMDSCIITARNPSPIIRTRFKI